MNWLAVISSARDLVDSRVLDIDTAMRPRSSQRARFRIILLFTNGRRISPRIGTHTSPDNGVGAFLLPIVAYSLDL